MANRINISISQTDAEWNTPDKARRKRRNDPILLVLSPSKYALLIVAMLQLYLKQITVERSTVGRNKRGRVSTTVTTETVSNGEKLESSQVGFLEKMGKNLRKYWKIGIDWLTSLKELLSAPFDACAEPVEVSGL